MFPVIYYNYRTIRKSQLIYKENDYEKTLIIMPAYNVEEKIGSLLDKMSPYQERVLIINDGSKDLTSDVIKNKGFIVLSNDVNKGIA